MQRMRELVPESEAEFRHNENMLTQLVESAVRPVADDFPEILCRCANYSQRYFPPVLKKRFPLNVGVLE